MSRSCGSFCDHVGMSGPGTYSWEKTAKATCEVYRSTVLRPSERSLRMRRLLRDVIIDWSATSSRQGEGGATSVGIREAYKALEAAVRERVRRELRRLHPRTAGTTDRSR